MTIKSFLQSNNYVRKLRMEDRVKYTLVFGSVKEVDQMGEGDDMRPALRLTVRDRADGEVKGWTTSSMGTLDKLADLVPGDVFTVIKKSVKVGGRYVKGYDIEIIGHEEAPEEDPEERPAFEELSTSDDGIDVDELVASVGKASNG